MRQKSSVMQLPQFVPKALTSDRPETAIVLQVDAAVQDAAEYAPDDLPDEIAIKGRGGTDFRPGSAWLDQQGIRPGVCLYFTDMECSSNPRPSQTSMCSWSTTPVPRRIGTVSPGESISTSRPYERWDLGAAPA